MAYFPGTPLFWLNNQFTDDNGDPLALGYLLTYAAGTSTPLVTYSDASLTVANPTQIDLDAVGRPSVDVFLSPTGYKIEVYDASDVLQKTYDDFENPGAVFADLFGGLLSVGAKSEASGYIAVTSDRLITMDGTGASNPGNLSLPPAANFTFGWLAVQNVGATDIAVSPNGSDTINSISGVGAFTIPRADTVTFPVVIFLSDQVSAWYAITNQFMQTTVATFATLPQQPKQGMHRTITDSNTATWGATAAAGGSNKVGVYYNGTNWTVYSK